ncbi:hypothetical protein BpHYR1_032002 [Brachionus plicatilis]|uniref:Uncharacterized protein n=1 Tax=Brachionus plicatilis TaxID=10195 RepID=A0A3M7SFW2_BRAPC|nr:hypothetical protein BpHYR1_032002 [Brachionus plicatilis]
MEQLEAKAPEQTNAKEKRGRPTKAQCEAKRAAEELSLELSFNLHVVFNMFLYFGLASCWLETEQFEHLI